MSIREQSGLLSQALLEKLLVLNRLTYYEAIFSLVLEFCEDTYAITGTVSELVRGAIERLYHQSRNDNQIRVLIPIDEHYFV